MRRARVRDFALYVAIGLTLVLLVVWGASHEISGDVVGRWGGLAVNTAILFGYTAKHHRASLKRGSFWFVISSLFILHLLLFVHVLQTFEGWRLAWWIIATPIEYVVVGLVLVLTGHPEGR